ncbi:hypothetical protein ACFFX0_26420 [Citricoccus parietis]|uniref:Uncharacterized protein n=1 Tax=Citricoccus parietis TaxID=592307 RepID=A0ABV5G6H1_9MICC
MTRSGPGSSVLVGRVPLTLIEGGPQDHKEAGGHQDHADSHGRVGG